jgi:hypothetical protein
LETLLPHPSFLSDHFERFKISFELTIKEKPFNNPPPFAKAMVSSNFSGGLYSPVAEKIVISPRELGQVMSQLPLIPISCSDSDFMCLGNRIMNARALYSDISHLKI